jgi:hypothetical protein
MKGKTVKGQKCSLNGLPFVPLTAVIFFNNLWVAGNTQGKLACFDSKNAFTGKYYSGHEQAITILLQKDASFFSGGREGRIIQWNG